MRVRLSVCRSVSLSVCVSVCLSVCEYLASDSLETIEVIIIITLSTVIASDMRMHHFLIILTLTFIQRHTDNIILENNKRSIISETVHAIRITFAVKIVRL